THLNFFIAEQLPVLPPDRYTPDDIAFIVPRVLELVYTAHDLKAFAEDLGYHGPPFGWHPERRALLRAELDACYARLYGLNRDELRYILDPADVLGPDYPSETFRVLKNKEMKEYGEYRTARLVLAAWDGGCHR
ncbi:MAG: restriction endonuclease, partial [Magnetococcales bacterium]|nr:restriction endonuclease [Magnetococcales bacterium]